MAPADGGGAPLADAVVRALGPDGELAREHAGYVVREGQLGLGRAIADAISDCAALIAEAGTGTGKTFAYLVPALLSGGRVLVSTGTRNLQDQLYARDVPEIARALGVRADVALLKGRSNYVCWLHLKRNLAEGRFARREDIADLRRIERFAVITDTGDRAELESVGEEAPAWSMATSTRENCLGQECPELARCFLFKARQAAQRADVIVVNHHLLCADLALRDEGVSELLPTTDTLIFDEAHQLPEVATQFFGQSVSSRQLVEFARDLMRAGLAEAADAADWIALSRALEQSVRELRLQTGSPGRIDAAAVRARPALVAALRSCIDSIESVRGVLDRAAERGREVQRCALRAAELVLLMRRWLAAACGDAAPVADGVPGNGADGGAGAAGVPAAGVPAAGVSAAGVSAAGVSAAGVPVAGMSAAGVPAAGTAGHGAAIGDAARGGDLIDADASLGVFPATDAEAPGDTVVWAEVHASGVTLHATPLSVARVFRRHRDARPRAWVFVSATLAVGGALDHFARAIGLDDARRLVWPSPFDFASQALLYVPQGLGEPSGPDFARRVFDASWPLVCANRGRAFVLCTTLRMVEQLATRMRDALASAPVPMQLLVQGEGSRAELLERFRREPAPVLIGSASFWEGVDVPGQQLSLVVIDKLPFAPPDDPVLRARSDAARRAGEDPFRTLQLTAAAMALKQGAGRLIRSERDHGVLMVCDVRLADKPYGRTLLRSLPPFRRTRSLEEVLAFVERADDAAGRERA